VPTNDCQTVTERSRLQELEEVLERDLQAFYRVGEALLEIRDTNLYKQTHKTFEDYCSARWSMKRNYANKLISAATVVNNLGTTVPKPTSEGQARPLAALPAPQQREVWTQVLRDTPLENVTAKIIVKPMARMLRLIDRSHVVSRGR